MSPRRGLDLKIIVEAAAELADTSGFEEITLSSLAAKLGVRSPSLYNHVNGLPALRTELAVYVLGKMYKDLKEALEGKRGSEAIHALAQAYVAFGRAHPGLYALTVRAPVAGNLEHTALADQLVRLLVEAMRFYEQDEEQAIHYVRGFRSLLHGFVTIEGQGGFGMKQSVDESVSISLQAYLDGMSRNANEKRG